MTVRSDSVGPPLQNGPLWWSELEGSSSDELAALEDHLVRRQVAYLWKHSPFYRDKFRGVGAEPGDVTSREDLSRVPFTEKDEIRASLAAEPPLGRHLAAPSQEVIQVQATSGTTGTPSFIGLTVRDLDAWSELGARAFYAGGLRPADVVLHGWSMSKGFAGGVPVVRMLQHLGCRVLPIGAEAGSDRLLVIAAAQRATGLCATPNFALYLGEQADRVLGRPASETGIRRLIVGGEPGGGIPALRSRLEATWQATSCEVLGNSDIATIVWAECEQAHDGMHFIGQGLVLAELIDPTSGQVVEARSGLRAEIVYTALVREASPLLRFRSRDHVEIIGTECECGRTSLRLRCFGRTDDMLIVKGVNVWPTAVQELVLKFRPRTTGAMRIILDFPGHATSGPLRVRIEHAANLSDQERADLRDDIARQIRQLLIIRAEVELVPPDTLEKPGATKVSLVVRELGSAT